MEKLKMTILELWEYLHNIFVPNFEELKSDETPQETWLKTLVEEIPREFNIELSEEESNEIYEKLLEFGKELRENNVFETGDFIENMHFNDKKDYYTTKKDVIDDLERGMGDAGAYNIAKKMFNLLEKDDLIKFDPELQKYVCVYSGDQFLEYWENADKTIQRKIMGKIRDEDLTELPIELREAIMTKRDAPEKFNRKMYFNILNNLLKKGAQFFSQKAEEYKQKAKVTRLLEKVEL